MKIIYLSGIDGCGKTTQAKLLAATLKQQGIKSEYMWCRWEPSLRKLIDSFKSAKIAKSKFENKNRFVETENATEGEWASFKRKILANPLIKKLWLLYACLDYFHAYRKRFKLINADVLVIDRYVNDFIIDQAVNLDIAPDATQVIEGNFFLKKFHFPDFKIIIDLPSLEGYTRKNDGTSLSYLKIREKYYQALKGYDTVHLDGLHSVDELASQITGWVAAKLETGKI